MHDSSKMKMEDDRISSLPDALLCHILGFLTTKEAVATSVLSKRWKPLWRSVSTLDFDDRNYSRFVESVYRVILSRDFHQPIQKFRLHCFSRHFEGPSHVSVWVNAATLRRRVEHIDISLPRFLSCQSTLDFSSIFSCTTLVVLKLDGLVLKTVSSVVDLPLLKVLHLEGLVSAELGCLAKLLSGCPVLEEWKASGTYFENNDYETDVEFKTLPKLVTAHIPGSCPDFFMMKVVNNVQFLRIHQIYSRLPLPRDGESMDMFHNLIHIELVYDGHYESDWLEVLEFLKYCPKLQVLVINQPQIHCSNFLDELDVRECRYPPSVPECILLHLKRCYLNDYRGTEQMFELARYIMRNGRFLERMTMCSSSDGNQQGKLKNIQKLSSCTRCSATCKLSFK